MTIPGTFTDMHGNSYRIQASETSQNHVYLTMLDNHPSRWISPEDAPAVALAILEAAGHGGRVGLGLLNSAACNLRQYVEELETKRVEQEAEEAAALDWIKATDPWAAPVKSVTQNQVRAWKRNRDYFSKIHDEIVDAEIVDEAKAPEPLVVNLGDPEPDRTKAYLEGPDGTGDTWRHDVNGWGYEGTMSRYTWERLQKVWPEVFPLTEDTE